MEEQLESLKNIERMLAELKGKIDTDEIFAESDKTIAKIEAREEYAVQQIQNSFDRLHDKVFNFNNITLGAFLVLGTFPEKKPLVSLWTAIFPLFILVFMMFLDWRQMEIHRYSSNETKWTDSERNEYGRKIDKQSLLSLLALIASGICFLSLIFTLIFSNK